MILLYPSHPARDAWIEINSSVPYFVHCRCRIPRGMRGLKSLVEGVVIAFVACRIPRGMRGLKFYDGRFSRRPPGRIPRGMRGLKFCPMTARVFKCFLSHPARDAWIEIINELSWYKDTVVASREGCVD